MKHLNVPLTEEFHKRLKRYCLETDQDMTELIRRLLEEFLEKAEKKLRK
jgi:hypothetical protein